MPAETHDTADPCAQCGAASVNGLTCLDAFHALLGFEFADREAFGPVHHLTVACYYLQHPHDFTDEVRASWRELLDNPEAGRAHAEAMLPSLRRKFDGAKRVRDPGHEAPVWWPRHWPYTAQNALPANEDDQTAPGHVRRMRTWAASVRETLDAAEQRANAALRVRMP